MHLLFEAENKALEILTGKIEGLALSQIDLATLQRRVVRLDQFENVAHLLADGLRIDAMFGVVGDLTCPTPVGLAYGLLHRVRDPIGIHDDLAVHIAVSYTHLTL